MKFTKKERKDCFLGLHFDFHAMEGETVGTIIDTDSIERMLDETKPDMIQVDTKGHPGISSYMTKAGEHASEMKMDVLKVWRDLTAKRGIRLYAHHSGLFDQTQARLHPDWAVVEADGTVSDSYMSPFGPYVDEVLIPQMMEIAGEYGVNGIWVDGECWGAFVDYSEHAKKAWKEAKGVGPAYPGDEKYEEYKEFCRDGFRNYVTHYIETVKAKYPDFEMTSNWMYSHYMPEKRQVPIDFISGDYSCNDSVKSARVVGRCCANQNITWDLMAWGQNAVPPSWETRNRCTKEGLQLCQEAAVVLGLGGGFQFFNILYGTGGLVQDWAIDSWREVSKFCREREAFCFHAKSIADIAVIYPRYYSRNPERKALFTGAAWSSVQGWVSAIADIGYSCDVVNEADLGELSKYKVIVMPMADGYEKETLDRMTEFARNGGTVIADGGVTFEDSVSGVTFAEGKEQLLFLDGNGRLSAIEAEYYEPNLTTAKELLYCYEQNYYYESERHVSCVVNEVGAGKVASLCVGLGRVYNKNITYALKQYMKEMFDSCGYVPFISVEGSDYADVSLMAKDGKIMVNILNTAGEHNSKGVRTFHEIPQIGPLKVKIRTKKKPEQVMWQPDGIELEVIEETDGYTCTIDRLHIHGIVEIKW